MDSPLAYCVGFWVISSAVRALPTPDEVPNCFYRFCYAFLHGLLANWDRVDAALQARNCRPK